MEITITDVVPFVKFLTIVTKLFPEQSDKVYISVCYMKGIKFPLSHKHCPINFVNNLVFPSNNYVCIDHNHKMKKTRTL